ncbi:MAG: M56 family metallopeptidase [Sphingomicrobium sp.]
MIAWLTDTLVATSILMALVMIVREPVRRLFGAGVAYALWLLPAARVVMPTLTTTVERAALAAPVDVSPVVLGAMPAAAPVADPIDLQGIALWLWLAVAAILLLRGLLIYRRQRRAVLADAVQIARLDKIRIVRTFALRGPMAFGIFDCVIALPADFDDRYDHRQRRLALDHELAHHRSGDLIANHIAFVLLCLQWFNPIAWLAHAAYRFDQEAACDARVLDKADRPDRAAYGQAIAKAASGRALLFSGALDRPSTLQRRLKTMLVNPNRRRRIAGRTMIVAGLAVALPLTASWATRYVDVPIAAVAPREPIAPMASTTPLAAAALVADVVAPTPPTPPTPPRAPMVPDLGYITNDTIQLHGRTLRWDQLSKQERDQVRAEVDKARRQLARERTHIDRDMAGARDEMAKFRNGDFQREMANARVEMASALRELDANAADIRRSGQDPEMLKAQVRASLREVEHMDVEKIARDAMASVNPDKMKADLEQAEASLARATARLDQLDGN